MTSRVSFVSTIPATAPRMRGGHQWCLIPLVDLETRQYNEIAHDSSCTTSVAWCTNGRKFLWDGVAESCKVWAEYSGSSRIAETQKTDAGWRSQPGMQWWLRRKVDGTCAVWLLSWSAMGSAWTSLRRDTNLTGRCSARTCVFGWASSVADAGSENVITKKTRADTATGDRRQVICRTKRQNFTTW